MKKEAQGVRWVFTINNFTYEEEELIRNMNQNPNVKFIIAEEEHLEEGAVCVCEGTPHIQGYLHLKARARRRQVEMMLGGRAFVEVARGTEEENIKYCQKEEQVIINFGTPTNHAGRSITSIKTNEDAKEMIQAMRELNEEEFEAVHTKYFLMRILLDIFIIRNIPGN